MKTAKGQTRAQAWLDTLTKLDPRVDGGRVHNLITEIEEPKLATPQSREIEAIVDEALRASDNQPLITVAETIFPMTEYKRHGIQGVYDYSKTIWPHIKKLSANRKGTYALRLVERQCANGEPLNPLEYMIDKMKKQLAGSGARRGIYEMDMLMEPGELKFYEPESDKGNHRGGQCLSHLSFKLGPDHELYLTAMYRYQYMLQKGLGNYRGLANLQAVVARELNLEVGPLVVHATLAYLDLDTIGGRGNYDQLVERCQAVVAEEVAA